MIRQSAIVLLDYVEKAVIVQMVEGCSLVPKLRRKVKEGNKALVKRCGWRTGVNTMT